MIWELFSSTLTVLFFIGLAIMAYAHYIEPHTLDVTHHHLKHGQTTRSNLRIIQISDIHLGDHISLKHFDFLIDHVNALDPDVVLLTGDLLDAAERYKFSDQIGASLARVKATYGKYAIYGNHEYSGGGVAQLAQSAVEGNFELLVNQIITVKHPTLKISIGGADCAIYGERRPEFCADFNENHFNLLMLHQADAVHHYHEHPIDVVLSGHTHAGQIAFPFLGALILPEMGRKFVKGWYDLKTKRGTQLYVNRGFGMTMLPFRLLSKPEISVFDIS